jgi:hypothetical protein
MQVDAVDPAASVSGGDHINDHRPPVEESQEPRSASMGDDGTATAGQGGRTKAPLIADPRATHRKDSTEDPVQPPVRNGSIDRGVAQADRS